MSISQSNKVKIVFTYYRSIRSRLGIHRYTNDLVMGARKPDQNIPNLLNSYYVSNCFYTQKLCNSVSEQRILSAFTSTTGSENSRFSDIILLPSSSLTHTNTHTFTALEAEISSPPNRD